MNQLDLNQLWLNLAEPLRRFLVARLADPTAVEDLLQDIFLAAYLKREQLHDPERSRAWLWQIARRKLIDRYRSRRETSELDENLAAEPQQTPPILAGFEQCVQNMLARLPAQDRLVLQRTAFEGISQQALSLELGLSFSGTKSRVQRARQKLRLLFDQCCAIERDADGHVLDCYPQPQSIQLV
ncbi:sigma-70 family RNA polymerase sigma factor [Herpetosiphon sp. NSE202]|uniref:sigma-70 family RNA polymerase sigma factor n=1 Tax=Herpetosiphon sp. NSE202 TaxID=3351349 RepID=UPI00364209B3